MEIQRYLTTGSEFECGKEVKQRNTDIVQAVNTPVCGHLYLFVLKSLTNGEEFQSILNHMKHYGYPQDDWEISCLNRKRAMFYQSTVLPGLLIHYIYK